MTVRKHRSDWMVDITVSGQRIREYGFKTRTLAKARETEIRKNGGANNSDQTLVEFVDEWQRLHGHTLKDPYRYPRTRAIAQAIDCRLKHFTASHFTAYRSQRLTEVSVSTVNHETRYLRSVFNEMIRLGQYHGSNPIASIRTLKEKQTELHYLSLEQVKTLLHALSTSENPSVETCAMVCLSTGARWKESQNLQPTDLSQSNGRYLVRFGDTKNGQIRYVQIDESLYLRLQSSLPFKPCRDAFRSTVSRTGFDMPPGQLTHILRHTFASWFMMRGGDVLTLSRILGHSDIKVTMRYAHLSPDHLSQVLELNPMAAIGYSMAANKKGLADTNPLTL